MTVLTKEHIDFIIKDLHNRGLILEGLDDEVIDHVCSAVEARIREGARFADAYDEVIRSFGDNSGLHQIQKETLALTYKTKSIMIANYLTMAFRQLAKGKLYTIINAAGLAIGAAACLLILLFIHDELSYDSWNKNANRIVRFDLEIKFGPNHVRLANSPPAVANALLHEYPEIESTVRFKSYNSYLVRPANSTINSREANVIWTDSTFFKVFPVSVLQGNPMKALTEINSLAISRRIAEKYFPDGNAMGQLMILDNMKALRVTAVYENIPSNSHFHFDILASFVGDLIPAKHAQADDFLTGSYNTYLLLKPGAAVKGLKQKLPRFIEKYMGKAMGAALGTEFNLEKFTKDGNKYEATLMPLRDIHLRSDRLGELEPNSSIVYVYLFGTIAVLVLGIACINFMNLSTARSAGRAKEVGVRKAMGSLRSHLVRLFLTESILISFISVVIALTLAWLVLPLFNELALKELTIPFNSISFFVATLGAALTIGVLAGIYPALFLSSMRPANIFKGKTSGSTKNLVRNGMVVFQFVISIFLIIGTLTVNSQLSYIQNKKIGFEKSQVIIVKDGYALRPNPAAFKDRALQHSSIQAATMSTFVPIDDADAQRNMNATWKYGKEPSPENMVNMQCWMIDEDYIRTYGMNVIEGRNFSKEFPSDAEGIILNKEAISLFNFEGNPIGSKIQTFMGDNTTIDDVRTFTVIGIVENFHFTSVKENIRPLGMILAETDNAFAFRFEANQASAAVKALSENWNELAPGQPFRYSFLDEDFGKMYASEQKLGRIFEIFSGLAIIIACIGLFALTAFTAEQRTKEIGIRKVLGASVPGIVVLLSKQFGKLILIAFVISAPLGWYAVNWWLTGYSYKTEVGVSVYLIAGGLIAFIAIVTMSFQSVKAALSDPVKSLRSE